MSLQSIPLKQYKSPLEAINSINTAHAVYKKAFGRNAKLELAFSQTGHPKEPIYRVAAWLRDEADEFTWFKEYYAAL